MKKFQILAIVAIAALAMTACCNQKEETAQQHDLVIEKQGIFSSGGRVTDPIPGEYDATQNWMDMERKTTPTLSIRFPLAETDFLWCFCMATDRRVRDGSRLPTVAKAGRIFS